MNMWAATPDDLLAAMSAAGVRRGWLMTDEARGGMRASHPILEPVAAAVSADTRDYQGHQAAFFEIGGESEHLLSACVHKTRRGQAAGGVRVWGYTRVVDFVRDGLRLSRGVGEK